MFHNSIYLGAYELIFHDYALIYKYIYTTMYTINYYELSSQVYESGPGSPGKLRQRLCAHLDAVDFRLTAALAAGPEVLRFRGSGFRAQGKWGLGFRGLGFRAYGSKA